ncbi:hypothetical protein [Ktedonosporobacter rubrisoli]|uniref:hypothetical protein n=1 Tax=Ktedonosporobacter rubrisoli TaxID=2509675 RepID=UPI0013EE4EC5|nr:hypothetical protein [Ktedonosporobacter rubrisoli]
MDRRCQLIQLAIHQSADLRKIRLSGHIMHFGIIKPATLAGSFSAVFITMKRMDHWL